VESGVTVCHEQDEDHDAWGGVNSTYGAVLALDAKATGSASLAREARQALDFTLYAIDDRGRPRDLPTHRDLGGWQEDAHTDVIHNYVDALRAFPEWGLPVSTGPARSP
jgi:alpha-beta hydrolase superfamily lysophospholipase